MASASGSINEIQNGVRTISATPDLSVSNYDTDLNNENGSVVNAPPAQDPKFLSTPTHIWYVAGKIIGFGWAVISCSCEVFTPT